MSECFRAGHIRMADPWVYRRDGNATGSFHILELSFRFHSSLLTPHSSVACLSSFSFSRQRWDLCSFLKRVCLSAFSFFGLFFLVCEVCSLWLSRLYWHIPAQRLSESAHVSNRLNKGSLSKHSHNATHPQAHTHAHKHTDTEWRLAGHRVNNTPVYSLTHPCFLSTTHTVSKPPTHSLTCLTGQVRQEEWCVYLLLHT